MGRLDYLLLGKRLLRWLPPLVIATGIITFSHFTLLQAAPTTQQLQDYLNAGNQLQVGTETNGGFRQVYYLWGSGSSEEKIFITKAPTMNMQPIASSQYIVFAQVVNGYTNIFQYNVLTDTTKQLTFSGTNMYPKAYLNQIVWQSWVTNKWQVMYHNGTTTTQISSAALGSAARPIIRNNQIRYTQELSGVFTLRNFIPSTSATTTVTSGTELIAGQPAF